MFTYNGKGKLHQMKSEYESVLKVLMILGERGVDKRERNNRGEVERGSKENKTRKKGLISLL